MSSDDLIYQDRPPGSIELRMAKDGEGERMLLTDPVSGVVHEIDLDHVAEDDPRRLVLTDLARTGEPSISGEAYSQLMDFANALDHGRLDVTDPGGRFTTVANGAAWDEQD